MEEAPAPVFESAAQECFALVAVLSDGFELVSVRTVPLPLIPHRDRAVLSDECELVSTRTVTLSIMPHKDCATRPEQRFGCV